LEETLVGKALPATVDASVESGVAGESYADSWIPSGYIAVSIFTRMKVSALADRSTGTRYSKYYVIAATSNPSLPELLVVSAEDDEPLEIWLNQIEPTETTVLRLLVDTWAKNQISSFIKGLNGAITK
jgi:hypothetical protein